MRVRPAPTRRTLPLPRQRHALPPLTPPAPPHAERKNTGMEQTVAEAKVDSVDNLTKSRDLESEKRSLDQTLQYTNERLQEVGPFSLSFSLFQWFNGSLTF